MSEAEKQPKKLLQQRLILVAVGVVVIAALATSAYFYKQYQKSQQLLQNPTLAAQQQTSSLLTQVGKLIQLPKDETPTIATVSDVTKLQGQSFFARAKNGDKVLIYTKNKKAILYDPVLNIIVDVAPVNINNITPSAASPTPAGTSRHRTPTPSK